MRCSANPGSPDGAEEWTRAGTAPGPVGASPHALAAALRPRRVRGRTVNARRGLAATAAALLAVALTGGLVASGTGRAAAAPVPAPTFAPVSWSELRFSAHKFFLSASTALRVRRLPASALDGLLRLPPRGVPVAPSGAEVVELECDTALPFGRDESVSVWLDPASGAAIQAEKTMRARAPYRKLFRYMTDGIYTWRTSPADVGESGLAPERWTRRGESVERSPVPVPAGAAITDPYALVYLASAAGLDRPASQLSLLILSNRHLVQLTFRAAELTQRRLSFVASWPGGETRRDADLTLRRVLVTARPLDASASGADVDLGFLGMRGSLTILLEAGTSVPVEISGRAEHIGALTVRLDRVALVAPPSGAVPGGSQPAPSPVPEAAKPRR